MISTMEIDKKKPVFTIPRIANELTNQANCILSNSQFILDVWEDVIHVLTILQRRSTSGRILVNDIPLEELKKIIPTIIKSNINSAGKVSGIANLLLGIEEFGDLFPAD